MSRREKDGPKAYLSLYVRMRAYLSPEISARYLRIKGWVVNRMSSDPRP